MTTVRFKSEYQKSYGVSRPRSVSPQRRLQSSQAGSRCYSGHRKDTKLPSSPGTQADSEPAPDPGTPAEPGPPAGPQPPGEPGPAVGPQPIAEPAKMSKSESFPQPRPPNVQQSSANQIVPALHWKAGLRSGGHRSGGHRSEYHRQYSWKKPAAASPLLTGEQMLYSSSRSVPPYKNNPVPMETEYQRSFQDLVPIPAEARLHKHLESHRIPLFHIHLRNNKKRREGPEKKPHPDRDITEHLNDDATPPPQVQRQHRKLTEYQSSFRSPLHRIPEEGGATDSDACQVAALRRQASLYRRQAWGINFSRDHLNQLLSEHNVLWEPTDSDPTTPRLTSDPCHNPNHHSSVSVEALDLPGCSSGSSDLTSAHSPLTNGNATAERREEELSDEEEGRLPTPRLKMLPVQRTHHDLTTPAAGGAILVGKLKREESSPSKLRRGSAVSMTTEAGTVASLPVRCKEAWSENNPGEVSSPHHKTAAGSPSKPLRGKPPSPVAPPPLAPPPHCIQGSLRHADFQHNGDLGLRFRELPCPGGGCGSDEDDRMSVMSWRSAASCSAASALLERAQKRREEFWGKK